MKFNSIKSIQIFCKGKKIGNIPLIVFAQAVSHWSQKEIVKNLRKNIPFEYSKDHKSPSLSEALSEDWRSGADYRVRQIKRTLDLRIDVSGSDPSIIAATIGFHKR